MNIFIKCGMIIPNEVMIMYREIEQDFLKWKNGKHKKPLLLSGARQVGKTYSILEFVKKEYDSYIYVNFERDLDVKQMFEKTAMPKELIMFLMSRFPEGSFSGNFVIVLDEIQSCPQALTTIKFLSIETEYDYIISGSLLGVAVNRTSSYPVGYIQSMTMMPMSFKEFLYANKIKEQQINYLEECFHQGNKVIEGIHDVFMDLFRKYVLCGGMPAVVKAFCESNDFIEVREIQQQIIDDYYRDMAKYADASEKVKTHECFASIPEQLSKENKKFQYKLVQNGGNAKIYESSLQWLADSGTIQKCFRLKAMDEPLKAYRETNIFKIYMSDTGLLVSLFPPTTASKLLTNELGIYKGAIYENITAQFLKTNGHELYYFEPSAHSEIDFILNTEQGPIPVEVKSGGNTRARSLKAYVDKYKPHKAYRFSTHNVNTSHSVIKDYPLYMLMFL